MQVVRIRPTCARSKIGKFCTREPVMAIYSVNMSNIQRSSGENAVKSAAYISGTKLTLKLANPFTGIESVKIWDFKNKPGVVYSAVLAPDSAPKWALDREELWNRAENFELSPNAQSGNRLMVALPRELTVDQNIELAREFTLEYLVNHGMIVDLNIHYDNEHNPHMHLQMTTRELVVDAISGAVTFSHVKNRNWVKKFFVRYLREGVATVINRHLELQGSLSRVSHLSHKARGIELIPGIHEGTARHMSASERRAFNEAILTTNASAICSSPELVFQKLSINKPVFTREDIAAALSDALYRDMEIGGSYADSNNDDSGNACHVSLSAQYANEFIVAYENLLKSSEIKLINPCDLRGRTLYAFTARLELEARFISTVEELRDMSGHNLGIVDSDIDKASMTEWLRGAIRNLSKAAGLSPASHETRHTFTQEQRAAVISVVNGQNISLLEGFPGSGKTATMREIVRQYRKAGYRVIGTATSASAAEVLGIEAGIESINISRLRKVWQQALNPELEFELTLRADYYKEDQYRKVGASLTNKDVLIIDEASMVELANIDYLLSEVKATGAKAILVGDNNQLAAIGMTGAFKKASQIVCSNVLTSVMRHKSSDLGITHKYREATKLLGRYKVSEALEIYDSLGVFNIHKTEVDTKAALVKDYVESYIKLAKHLAQDNLASSKSLVIGTYTNTAVNHFNTSIREHLKAAGILKGRSYTFRSGNETIELTKGEQIVFLENKPKFQRYYGILNGEVGTVLSFLEHPDEFGRGVFTALVHKADGSKRVVTISTKDNIYSARFKHGYAVTGYKLQGDTAAHMMVYYESVIGFEAFNVLMTRHRESVRLYAAENLLEDALYSKIKGITTDSTQDRIKIAREKYDIEAYKLSDGSQNKNRTKIPAWRMGLTAAVSRRVDNSFSVDYAAQEYLSGNEQTIKGYIESRELTFALRIKLDEWKARVLTPKLLSKLKLQKSEIDLYTIRSSNDHVIWSHLSPLAREELQAIFNELALAKNSLQTYAKLICDNYNNTADSNKGISIKVSDLVTQLSINYETLQRHAGYSKYGYYLKERNKDAACTLLSNPHFISMVKVLETVSSARHSGSNNGKTQIDVNLLNAITDIQNSHKIITEHLESTKLALGSAKEELIKLQTKDKGIKDEIDTLTTYITKLFPEYLSRIYKENPSDVIAKWDRVLQANGGKDALISNIASSIYKNPKLLGNLRGLGFSNILYLNKEREAAIANLDIISQRLKEYEAGKRKLAEFKDYIASSEYSEMQMALGAKMKEIVTLEQLLPSKGEDRILNELTDILRDPHGGRNMVSLCGRLKEFAELDEVQDLIYEHYNYKQDYVKNTANTKTQRARLTYEQVNSNLTSSHYEQIFRELARQINEDAPKITRSGNWINSGSLGMNLQNGTWKRLSTNESGNIYSFAQLATGYSKLEALEFVANKVNIPRDYKSELGGYEREKYQIESKTKAAIAPAPSKVASDEWIPYGTVPHGVKPMNPKTDFAWIMQEHDIAGIYEYRNISGNLIGGTMRLVSKATGEKQVLPYVYCKNEATNQNSWRFKGFTDHGYKPIYGTQKLNQDKRTILIVEGEKTADSAQTLFPEYAVMSWLGGSGAVDKVNWTQLKGRNIVIFPDNDVPGMGAAYKILNHLNRANDKIGYAGVVDLSTLGKGCNQFPAKWDLADALPEGVRVTDIKYAIESAKEQSRHSLNFKVHCSTLESNLAQVSISAILEQYKYLEAKGVVSPAHEFLKPEHGLHRDILTCLIPQIESQAQGAEAQNKALQRHFITALENKYDELISHYNSSGSHYFEHYDSIHQKHEKSLEARGKDRVSLYTTMMRDVTLLHSLELNSDKLTKTHYSMIANKVYSAIKGYNRPFSKTMQSNALTTKEKIDIAEIIHTLTATPALLSHKL